MPASRRMKGRLLTWAMTVTILGVGYVMFIEPNPRQEEKQEANRIMSPWDLSSAPPPYVDGKSIKVKPLPQKPAQNAAGPKKQGKKNARANDSQGQRVADAKAGSQARPGH